MVFLSSSTSPLTSTVIFFERSPVATAVVTSAMFRTWPVRFAAIELTLSVRSFQTRETAFTCAWPPRMPSVPTSRATRVTSSANAESWSTIVLIVFLSSSTSPRTSTVIFRERSPFATAVVTSAMLRTCDVRLPASVLTLSVRSFHVPDTPGTWAWPPRMPSVPTSRATRVTSSANDESWSTIVLIVFFSSAISPRASTVILRDRSPSATAVVTSAMLRAWFVRLSASWLTLLVRSRQVPETPFTSACAPRRPSTPTSRATRVTSSANDESWSTIVLIVFLSLRTSPLTSTVIFFERSPFATAVVTSAMFRTCDVRFDAIPFTLSVSAFHVPATPSTSAWPPSLPSVPTSRATRVTCSAKTRSVSIIELIVTRDARHLLGEDAQRVDHRVDRVGERGDFALRLDRELLVQVAVRDGGDDLCDTAHLGRQVRRHEVDVVGQVLPGAADALHVRLAAEDALGADLAGDARDLVGERGQLVDHRVDRVLEPEDLALRVDRDLAREVALRDCCRHLGDVPHLVGEVRRHAVHRLGEAAPRPTDAFDLGLPAKLAVGSHLACDARDLGCEDAQRVDHRVDRVGERGDFALRLDRELLVQVSVCDGGDDLRDAAHLGRQIRRHEVDVVGQVLPGAADPLDVRLAAELAFGADLAGDAGDLVGERAQLVDDRVGRVLEVENFALDVDRDLLAQVAVRDGRRHVRDVPHLRRQVVRHEVDVVGQLAPDPGDAAHTRLAAELAFGADLARDPRDLVGERAQLVEHRVDGHADPPELAAHGLPVDRQ